jgi:hypothetical protein
MAADRPASQARATLSPQAHASNGSLDNPASTWVGGANPRGVSRACRIA